jgi:hypothetical protein
MSNDFQEFLVEKQKQASTERADERKEKWLESLNRLYSRLEGYLEPIIQSGAIRIEREKMTIREEFIGPYRAPKLRIWVVNSWVDLIPGGTYVGGAVGRVDLRGIRGSRAMVQREWGKWVILGRPPQPREFDLTEESFEQLLMRFAR